jgi:hypothetical protein
MKPNHIKTLLLVIFASLCLASQCNKEPEREGLPPETQTGANTFGCYVNGEIFVRVGAGGNPLVARRLGATYTRNNQVLIIFCRTENNQVIDMYINSPQEGKYNSLALAYFTPVSGGNIGSECWWFACENCNQIFITKFDTINRIVSGTFEFTAKCARRTIGNLPEYYGDSVVQVTEGRFDVRLLIFDN